MATKYFCDRCGKEVVDGNSLKKFTIPNALLSESTNTYEFCARCIAEVRSFCAPRPNEG